MSKRASQIIPKIGERLRAERERLGFSQDSFAKNIGITRVTQNYYENGVRDPLLSYLSAFGRQGGDLTYVLFGESENNEYLDLLDWDLFSKVWDWVRRVAVDAKGYPYPPEIQKKAFQLAYQACRRGCANSLEEVDLTVLFGMAA